MFIIYYICTCLDIHVPSSKTNSISSGDLLTVSQLTEYFINALFQLASSQFHDGNFTNYDNAHECICKQLLGYIK